MSDRAAPSTLRELRQLWLHQFSKPIVLMALAGVSVVLGLSGPFHTIDSLPTLQRLLYWGLIVWVTYGIGAAVYLWLNPDQAHHRWRRVIGVSLVIATLVSGFLILLNRGFLGFWPGSVPEIAEIWGFAVLVSTFITALSAMITPAHSVDDAPRIPALLQRLPIDKRGALVSVSVQDHYVDVITINGHEMLLMRLRDAIGETDPTPGLQVHRSHWVALDQITSFARRGDGAVITTTQGHTIPVSRSYMPAMRDHGLLPKPASK